MFDGKPYAKPFQSSLVTSNATPSVVGIRASSSVSSSASSSSKNLSGGLPSHPSRPSPTKTIGMQRPSPFANLSSVSRTNMGKFFFFF